MEYSDNELKKVRSFIDKTTRFEKTYLGDPALNPY